jgi:hypothetical protein
MSCYCGDCQKCGHRCSFCDRAYIGYFPNDKPNCDCWEKYELKKAKEKEHENILDDLEFWNGRKTQ